MSLYLRKSSRGKRRKGKGSPAAEGAAGQLMLDFSASERPQLSVYCAAPKPAVIEDLGEEAASDQRSSTENNSNNAWIQRFSDGNQNNNNKNNSRLVRCVRSSMSPPGCLVGTPENASFDVYPNDVPGTFDSPKAALSWLHEHRERLKQPGSAFSDSAHPELTVTEVFDSYKRCAAGKKKKSDQIAFEIGRERKLIGIYYALRERDWEPLPSKVFAVHKPKPREIWAAPFSDRVVHHLAHGRIEAPYTKMLSAKTFACLPGRGVHAAVQNVKRGAASATMDSTREAWVLKLDLSNFFQAIDLAMLWAVMAQDGALNDPLLAYIFSQLLFNQSRGKSKIVSSRKKMALIPRHKSLLKTPHRRGLPIGNLTSQWLANVYLTPLDNIITEQIRPASYTRYVDDLILIDPDIEKLHRAAKVIESAVREARMSLNKSKTRLFPVRHGIDAFGYFVLPGRIYVRQNTYRRIARRCAAQCARFHDEKLSDKHRVHALLSLGSYVGMFSQSQSREPGSLQRIKKTGFSPIAYGLNVERNISAAKSRRKNAKAKRRNKGRSSNRWHVLFRKSSS